MHLFFLKIKQQKNCDNSPAQFEKYLHTMTNENDNIIDSKPEATNVLSTICVSVLPFARNENSLSFTPLAHTTSPKVCAHVNSRDWGASGDGCTSVIPDNTPAATGRCLFHFFTPNMWKNKINSRHFWPAAETKQAGWKQRAKYSVTQRLFLHWETEMAS